MRDLTWMLTPQAIRLAKQCVQLINEEQGVKLRMSAPDFLAKLHELVSVSRSPRVGVAYSRLLAQAGVGAVMGHLGQATKRRTAFERIES